MLWTRKYFDQWEWCHRPVSPMEESLLLPEHINQSLAIITERLKINFPQPAWKIINGYLYLTGSYKQIILQPSILALPWRFFREFPIAAKRWGQNVLPEYLKQVEKTKKINPQKCPSEALIHLIKDLTDTESEFLSESVYVVLYAIASEIMLKIAYRLLVHDSEEINYHELLVGFPDAGLEADAELWQISKLTGTNRQQKLQDWIERFGHRIQDKDILYPTLGENPETIENLIKIYLSAVNPRQRIETAITRRLAREKFSVENLRRIPGVKMIFRKIKNIAQGYAKIRNSRPFYYHGNREIRRILFAIAARISWVRDGNDIFFLKFEELGAAVGTGNGEKFKQKIKARKSLYNQQLNSRPPLFVNI